MDSELREEGCIKALLKGQNRGTTVDGTRGPELFDRGMVYQLTASARMKHDEAILVASFVNSCHKLLLFKSLLKTVSAHW